MAELKRTLGFWTTCAFIFLNLVNTGIFFAVALASQAAGPGMIVAVSALALMSVYTAMCFAELTTMFPSAGGVYEFTKRAYGSFASFEIGWVVWLINNIATALLVIAAIEYLFPEGALAGLPISPLVLKTGIAIALIALMNYVAYRGAESSARLMLTLSLFSVVLFALLIVPGLLQIHAAQLRLADIHLTTVFIAMFLLSETFFGWESVSFMAEEIEEPERTIPRALIATTAFASFVALALALITVGVIGMPRLASGEVARPVIELLSQMGFPGWLVLIANVGIVLAFLGNAAGSIIGNPRLLMALSRDKLFIEQFAEIHPRRQTPYRAILMQSAVAILIVALAHGAYDRLLEMLIAPSLVLYAATLFLVPLFRARMPERERPYKAPGGRWLPLLLVAFYVGMLATWAASDPGALSQLRLLGSFMLFSIPIYLLLTYFYNPDAIITTVDRFAVLNLWFENVLVPRRVREEILELIPDANGKHLVELGAGVGSLTMHLAEHVGPAGKVYAIDFSSGNVRILERRVLRRGHAHVKVIHDPHLVNRIHPSVERADIAVSVGNLSYIQDVRKVLRELHAILPERGRVCFVEYVDFFWILPNNPKWLSREDEIQRIFAEAGFSVNVRSRRGIFWRYLFIYGVKQKSGAPYI